MKVVTIKYLLLGIIILTIMVVLGTLKLKKIPALQTTSDRYREKAMLLINELWKKQFIVASIGGILFIFSIIYGSKEIDSIFTTVFKLISLGFIAISAIFNIKNYNKFKEDFKKVLEEVYR